MKYCGVFIERETLWAISFTRAVLNLLVVVFPLITNYHKNVTFAYPPLNTR